MSKTWRVTWLDISTRVERDLLPSLRESLAAKRLDYEFSLTCSALDKPLATPAPDVIIWNPYKCGSALQPSEQLAQLRSASCTLDIILCMEDSRIDPKPDWLKSEDSDVIMSLVRLSDSPEDVIEQLSREVRLSTDRVLIISDLHFGSKEDQGELYEKLGEVRERALDVWESMKPKAIVVCGDVANRGQVSEYRDALRFFQGLVSKAGCRATRVGFVPGNHDVDRKVGPEQALSNFGDFIRQFYLSHDSDIAELESLFPLLNPKYWRMKDVGSLEPQHLASVLACQDIGLTFIGLPSTVVDPRKYPVLGWECGEILIDKMMKFLTPACDTKSNRVAFTHHDFMLVPDFFQPGQTLKTLDTGRLLEIFLNHRIGMLLHGHSHYAAGWQFSRLLHDRIEGKARDKFNSLFVFSTASSSAADLQRLMPMHHHYVMRRRRNDSANREVYVMESLSFDAKTGDWKRGSLHSARIALPR